MQHGDGAKTPATPAGVPGQLGHLSNAAWRTEPRHLPHLLVCLDNLDTCPMQPGDRAKTPVTPAGVLGQLGHLANAAW